MTEWLQQSLPDGYANAVLGVGLALILLFVVLVIIRLFRGMRAGTFVLGGRNRRTRLAVMDATAVDARRRLVLVRRDDVEHLILIGGPTDVVVEQDIRMIPRATRGQDTPAAETPRPGPSHADIQRARAMTHPPASTNDQRAAEPPRPAVPPRAPSPSPPPSHAGSSVTLPRPQMPMSAPPAPPVASTRPSPTPAIAPTAQSSRLPPASDISDELLKDIDLTLNGTVADEPRRPSPDEEMTRLLGELTKKRIE
ncbi:MAG: hypothetical protein WBF87_03375 [Mesorhizobium sp.]